MVEAVKIQSPARLRWMRFSLRGLFVGMLLVGLGLGWLASMLHAGWRRAAMVATVRAADGEIYYDYHYAGDRRDKLDTSAEPSEPLKVCGDWLGHDVVHQVAWIWSDPFADYASPPQSPIELEGLEHCTGLREVRLSAGMGLDTNLARLASARGLEHLYFHGKFTDRGLAPLRNHARLQELVLNRIPAGGEPISELPHSPELVGLYLYDFPVTDKVMAQISEFHGLELLALQRVGLTDADLERLASLTRVRNLSLDGNPIRGPGLAVLERLPALEVLSLRDQVIDEQGLASLARCRHWKRLTLLRTASAVETLERALSHVRIEWIDANSGVH